MKKVILLFAMVFLLGGVTSAFAHPPLAKVRVHERGDYYVRTITLYGVHQLPHRHKFIRWVISPHDHPHQHLGHGRYNHGHDRR